MKILFLTASTGGGHAKAAEAVMECIGNKCPGYDVRLVDSLKYISPLVDRIVVGSYLSTVSRVPRIYGTLYNLSEKDESLTDIIKSFNRILSRRLIKCIEEYKPSIIVCTHSFPLQMLSNLKQDKRVNIPVIGIVTDFVNHFFWKLEGVDAFIVAHDYIKKDMIRMGIRKEHIFTYGIPVSEKFMMKKDYEAVLNELNLKRKFTILLMGGSLGIGEVKDVFASLLNCGRDIQIIAVTGHNTKLKKQLESMTAGTGKSIKIFSYTERIPDLMDIADFIITKPGGVTISEALVKKLPILIISPIPGQEERNARFLVNSGVAAQLIHKEDMERIFCQIIDSPIRMKHMREMAAQLAKPDAGEKVLNLIESLCPEGSSFTAGISF